MTHFNTSYGPMHRPYSPSYPSHQTSIFNNEQSYDLDYDFNYTNYSPTIYYGGGRGGYGGYRGYGRHHRKDNNDTLLYAGLGAAAALLLGGGKGGSGGGIGWGSLLLGAGIGVAGGFLLGDAFDVSVDSR